MSLHEFNWRFEGDSSENFYTGGLNDPSNYTGGGDPFNN